MACWKTRSGEGTTRQRERRAFALVEAAGIAVARAPRRRPKEERAKRASADFRCQGSILRRIRCPNESPGVHRSLGDNLETTPASVGEMGPTAQGGACEPRYAR